MNKQEVKTVIFDMMAGILDATSFRLKKGEDGFVRKFAGGRHMLGIPLWDYNPQYEFSLNICIRLDAVETIFHQFSGSQPKYHPMSFTTITRLGYFTGDAGRYKVVSVADVANAFNVLSGVIQDKIIPFFDKHQDIQAIDGSVNSLMPSIDITQNPSGAMHAVILAHLAGNKNYESIVAKHRDEMQLAQGASHPFNHLVDYLKAG